MNGDGADREELLRQFESIISGAGLGDLEGLAEVLSLVVDRQSPGGRRPHLRRPPRNDLAIYRVRVDLEGARPPIWRRLDLRSDLHLDSVHRVLQASFDWLDYHLYRFSIGGGPFEPDSELFLCPFDIAEGEDDGVPDSDVRLDEVIQDPGDVLDYVYDYGDSWELKIRLEEVLPPGDEPPAAVCIDGRRAAPPEDCGGLTDEHRLAEVLDDPAHFDLDQINQSLRDPFLVLRQLGVPARLVEMATQLRMTDAGDDLVVRLLGLTTPGAEPSREEKTAALGAFVWFLDRAGEEGFALTDAGYLKPADVEAACEVVPAMGTWIGKNNREINASPLLAFRESLQSLGLFRKYKGRLLRTRAGDRAAGDPDRLWDHLVGRLASGRSGFDQDGRLLILVHAATSSDGSLDMEKVGQTLSHLGWVRSDGEPLGRYAAYQVSHNPLNVLDNVTDTRVVSYGERRLSAQAIALARQALIGSGK